MSVAVLIVAHAPLGSTLVQIAATTLGEIPLPIAVLDIAADADPEQEYRRGQQLLQGMEQEAGVLLLTDIYGATPCNVARRLLEAAAGKRRLISGLSLPMLLRTLNYPTLTLDELAHKAISGAHDGILMQPDVASEEQLNHA